MTQTLLDILRNLDPVDTPEMPKKARFSDVKKGDTVVGIVDPSERAIWYYVEEQLEEIQSITKARIESGAPPPHNEFNTVFALFERCEALKKLFWCLIEDRLGLDRGPDINYQLRRDWSIVTPQTTVSDCGCGLGSECGFNQAGIPIESISEDQIDPIGLLAALMIKHGIVKSEPFGPIAEFDA